jgi:hypothetical protein
MTNKAICTALSALAMLAGCEVAPESAQNQAIRNETGKTVNLSANAELQAIKASLIDGMISYMKRAPTSYGSDDIKRCAQILDDHLAAVQIEKNREEALSIVKATVLKLNQINEQSGSDLIETDQREQIAAFIIKAGALLGFNGEYEDVTEQWRDW